MHEARGLMITRRNQRGELLHQRNRRIASRGCRACQRIDVEELGTALRLDCRNGRRLDDSYARLGTRQRCFEVEHRLQSATVGEDGAHLLGCK